MRSANIRHLSVALEALSRVQGVEEHFSSIKGLLEREISLMQEDQHPPQYITPTKPNDDEEIPF